MKGKRSKKDVQEFQMNLMDNIVALHLELKNKTYKHSPYKHFRIRDPKPRDIHKATVRDRLLHHAIYRILYPFFANNFTSDSHSCQEGKGVHRAIRRFKKFINQVSRNNTQTVWVLKCDIKKFFASIDHNSLRYIVTNYIDDLDINWLIFQIISSFHTSPDKGLPLGNLISQLLVNIYMNEFDQFVKHKLKVKHYIRYADDFVVLSQDCSYLERMLPKMQDFLANTLKLSMHPDKISIKTVASGVDFLGWVQFPDHRVLRTVTKRRMLKNLSQNPSKESSASYLGTLKHGNAFKIKLLISP